MLAFRILLGVITLLAIGSAQAQRLPAGTYKAWLSYRESPPDHMFSAEVEANGAMTVALHQVNQITGATRSGFPGPGTNHLGGVIRAHFGNGYIIARVAADGVSARGVIVYWTLQGKVVRRLKLEPPEPEPPPPEIPGTPGVVIETQRRIRI